MLVKPDDATLTALARMSQSTDWEQVEKWLRESREGCIKQSLNESDAKSRQAQGAFVALDEIFNATQKARELSRR
jgi:hypothetical protein